MKNHNKLVSSIALAADHAGYKLKEELKTIIKDSGLKVVDLGTDSEKSVDYPEFGFAIAETINKGKADRGIAVCGSGIGISIASNRYKGIRAALCNDIESTIIARKHNDANVLAMGARSIDYKTARGCFEAFIQTSFEGERHEIRVNKLDKKTNSVSFKALNKIKNQSKHSENDEEDNILDDAINNELLRQQESVELIASENFVSKRILKLQGSILTNKYAEGYPGKRYYGGCEHVDVVENLAKDRLKKLFDCNWANVQPNSGSQANQAVFLALLNPGDKILGMSLSAGGHLTHGAKPNQSGKNYIAIQYGVKKENGLIDYEEVSSLAEKNKPKLIIAGASAYSRRIDFKLFRKIADKVGAYLLVDMAHYSGLIASKCYPSPLEHAHVCTSTTHKTLRGPRGGIILGNDENIGKLIDKAVFPGLQGGPLMHVIAAKAAAFKEAMHSDFVNYSQQTIKNARALASKLEKLGFNIVSSGTDCHMVLVDLRSKKINGRDAEKSLDRAGITCNKNSIPFDPESPFITSGIRLGTAAGTTRGFKEKEFELIAILINDVISGLKKQDENIHIIENETKKNILDLCNKFPLYASF